MKKRNRWLLITVAALALGLSYLAYSLFIHSGNDYLTVSELKSQATSADGQQIRIGGKIASGSISWDEKTRVISFALTDGRQSLPIVYQGIIPDNFKPGAEIIMLGTYQPDGSFQVLSFNRPRSLCNLCH